MLKGKTAVITGCARGIGRAVLNAYAASGADIFAHARTETDEFLDSLKAAAQQHGVEIRPLCFDLTDFAAMKEAVKKIMGAKKPVDVLVNNAGITHNALFQMTGEDTLRLQMEVNFFAPYLFTQYMAKLMVRRKTGSIVNIASTAGEDGNPGKSAYGASKAALIAMTKSIAAELGVYGIRANAIAPGITATEMLATMPKRVVEETKGSIDLGRAGLPSEIAAAAVFLGSDRASYVTGQVWRVDGGLKS